MELSMGQLQAVTKELAAAHRRGPRSENSRILDELVELASCTVTTPERRCRAAETLKVARAGRERPSTGPMWQARISNSLRATSRGPGAYAKHQVRRRAYRTSAGITRSILKAFLEMMPR
jgi:hypothetical protein